MPTAFPDLSGQPRWRACLLPVILALVAGVLGTWGFAETLAWTNTEQFCIGCHEMRDNVYAEYQDTIHDTNRTGVRATCADCHVPHATVPKLIRKAKASFELYGHFTGKLDTPEKFEAHRYQMALKVWTDMRASDSAVCRHCHVEAKMNPSAQTEKALDRHEQGRKEGLTCIDCHFGIAHSEPDGELTPKELGVPIQK
ncbi:MAG TPA: NapC/NirT family cytochrome c [Gammaproteobacteria bacterium]